MVKLNKILKIAATIFKDIDFVDDNLLSIITYDDYIEFTFWANDPVHFLEINIYNDGQITIDTNSDYIDLSNKPENINESSYFLELVEKFYERFY